MGVYRHGRRTELEYIHTLIIVKGTKKKLQIILPMQKFPVKSKDIFLTHTFGNHL